MIHDGHDLRLLTGLRWRCRCRRVSGRSFAELEEFSSCFMRKLWWLEMVNFIEVLEDIGCLGFWDVGLCVHGNLERIWH